MRLFFASNKKGAGEHCVTLYTELMVAGALAAMARYGDVMSRERGSTETLHVGGVLPWRCDDACDCAGRRYPVMELAAIVFETLEDAVKPFACCRFEILEAAWQGCPPPNKTIGKKSDDSYI